MLIERPIIFRKRRANLTRVRPSSPPPPALALVAVDALVVIGPEIEMNLVFNVTGADSMSDVSGAAPTKWSARYQGTRYTGSLIGNVILDTLYLQMIPIGPEAGADELSYSNAPSDISDSLGRFLAAFAGFPLT